MPVWISVKDKLPPEKHGLCAVSDTVLVIVQDGSARWADICFTVDGQWADKPPEGVITHWMPIPEFPPFDEEMYDEWLRNDKYAMEGEDWT